MGRPRKQPEDTPETEESKERKPYGKTNLKYDGPPGQVVQGIGELKPGKTYEIEDDLAESLLASSRHWKEA